MWSRMLAIPIYIIFQACVSIRNINGQLHDERIKVAPQLLREMGGTAALHNSATDLRSRTHMCGAVLISDRYLLTAAHCMDQGLITISLGREDLNVNPFTSDDTYVISEQERYIHHDYVPGKQEYGDIAIIKTDRKVRFTDTIWPFCLPARNQMLPDFELLQIAGWGFVNKSIKASVLQAPFVNLVKKSRCEELWLHLDASFYDDIIQSSYPEGLTRQLLCVARLGVQACGGDSGGPMALRVSGRQTVVGLISKGVRCPRVPTLPTFNTNVANYVDWIYEKTGLPRSSPAIKCGKAPTNAELIAPQPKPIQTIPSPAAPLCPSPYTHRGNECFFVSEDENDLLNWDEARDRCLRMGGVLAQPQDMVDFVKYITESYPNNKPTIWIGATDRAVEQDWYWLSGEPVPPALWKSSPSNQPSGDGDCMEIHTGWTSFDINDIACHAKGYFACEMATLPTKVTINQCVGDGEDNSILWDKVDSAETAIIMTVNDGNNNVRGAIEMELQFLKENITDANSKLEEELKIVKAKLDQIINKSECSEADGFFSLTGSSQCFKIFKDKTRDWYESKNKCKEEELVLAHPSDSIALRRYLVQTYGSATNFWVNANEDGSNIIWQDNGETFPKDSPLWWPGNPQFNDIRCVRLLTEDECLDRRPTKPYATAKCTKNDYHYALCSTK